MPELAIEYKHCIFKRHIVSFCFLGLGEGSSKTALTRAQHPTKGDFGGFHPKNLGALGENINNLETLSSV